MIQVLLRKIKCQSFSGKMRKAFTCVETYFLFENLDEHIAMIFSIELWELKCYRVTGCITMYDIIYYLMEYTKYGSINNETEIYYTP